MTIAWFQVLVAFFLGVVASAAVKSAFSSVKGKVGG
jgi:hypothetical protein